MPSGFLLLLLLALTIAFIVYATAQVKLHPFLALLFAAYGFGLLAGLPMQRTVAAITEGFGQTLGYIGIVIAAGTVIGALLEKSGGALVMANTVVRWIGKARSALAMSLTGAVISVSVFCDSGFIILAPLARSLAAQARQSMATFAVALSMGLYATHVFVPPTPGPIAAAGELEADIGTVVVLGIVVTIPVVAATYLFALYAGERVPLSPDGGAPDAAERTPETGTSSSSARGEPGAPPEEGKPSAPPMSAGRAFAPVVAPVLLIALRSVAQLPSQPFGDGPAASLLTFLGTPSTALLLGVLLAFLAVRPRGPAVYGEWVGEGLREAGTILLITGAGGALGSVLQATALGGFLETRLATLQLGAFNILLPFLIAAALKTALGSSTVAIITTASVIGPLIPALGLGAGYGPALTTLSVGAGAMTVSHANDSYFWVVSQFSGMTVSQAYRLQTTGSAVAGLTGILTVFALSLFML